MITPLLTVRDAAAAKVLFPVGDQPYGLRQGRVQDLFGHHWLLSRPLGE